jgi:NTE family protein
MKKIGLVLGAGGIVGQAYHAGVLAALEHDLHWDPRTADVIVGTSAGSITATLLRGGVPASELAAWTVRAPLSPEGKILEQLFGSESPPKFEPFRAKDLLRRLPSLPGPRMVRRALTQPWAFRPLPAAMALLGPGRLDVTQHLAALGDMTKDRWPSEGLWVCAVHRSDGGRVVFGRPGNPAVPLRLAVAASCAVPGYFAPVAIEGDSYVDGGAHSPTNADALRSHARSLDLVVIVSPMSGPSGLPRDPFGATRWHARKLVRREARALRARGTEVIVFEPGAAEQEVLGNDFMSSARVGGIVQASFLAAGAQAATPHVRGLLNSEAGVD